MAERSVYGGDGQLRIWRIGTHHDYEPDEPPWNQVESWLEAGVEDSDKARYEPFKKGSVQRAKILSAQRRHYVPVK